MGVVQDIYWKFCQIVDQYLWPCMACVDPDSESFDTLPPHFTKNMDEEPVIKEAFDLCFKNVFSSLDEKDVVNITGLLLRCLASMVHHAEAIKRMMRRSPRHAFHSIVVFTDLNLLERLKCFVTTDPS